MAAADNAWSRALQPITSRPHLAIGVLVGLLVCAFAGHWLARPVTRGLVGWDCGVIAFIVLSFNAMRNSAYERMRARAIAHDEGRHFMLALAMLAAAASVAAIVSELSGAKDRGHLLEAFSVTLTAATIALSWFFVHLVFAIHYAHVYYLAEDGADSAHRCGLDFPGDEAPDYWDFLYFSVIIGATSQTADVNIRSKEIRRTVTAHCLVSFAFNTAILATMINLAAGLF
jgi:uncharacterized membrane protein